MDVDKVTGKGSVFKFAYYLAFEDFQGRESKSLAVCLDFSRRQTQLLEKEWLFFCQVKHLQQDISVKYLVV